jgi:hypothetical protein
MRDERNVDEPEGLLEDLLDLALENVLRRRRGLEVVRDFHLVLR